MNLGQSCPSASLHETPATWWLKSKISSLCTKVNKKKSIPNDVNWKRSMVDLDAWDGFCSNELFENSFLIINALSLF